MAGRGGRFAMLVGAAGVFGGLACAPSSPPGQAAVRHGAIYGGALDTEHLAVMALGEQVDATHARGCSGTTILRRGGDAFLLTAAHCVVERDANNNPYLPLALVPPSRLRVIPAADWAAAFFSQFFPAAATFMHPNYAPETGANDVAVVRYTGATAATPTIPILELGEDTLRSGSPITLVGYGETESDTQATQRREVDRAINVIGTAGFDYSQLDGKGSCFGDSGGPALFDSAAGVRVAGVMVRALEGCRDLGLSLRVSRAAEFIHGVIDPVVPDGGPDAVVTDAQAPADATTTTTTDATASTDAPAATDATDARDATATTDASDANASSDVSASADAGPSDAGAIVDTGAIVDASAIVDAGVDASAPDGRRDTGAILDAGADGRPEPSSAAGCGCSAGADSPSPATPEGAALLAIAAAMAARRRRAEAAQRQQVRR